MHLTMFPYASPIQSIILQPRPLSKTSGKLLLLPLLPSPAPLRPLPVEVWSEIVAYVLMNEGTHETAASLLRVCKGFTDVAKPLFYEHVDISTISALDKFQKVLLAGDQKWDSLRRIPYSTPGRWVQTLDFSKLAYTSQDSALEVDTLLTRLFPLVPFLTRLVMSPSFVLSRRALGSLGDRDGAQRLRCLEGIAYSFNTFSRLSNDPLVRLLRLCPNLEELDVLGQGPDPADLDALAQQQLEVEAPDNFVPLDLPQLHTLSLLSMHTSPLMVALLNSTLPALKKVTLTPYDDIDYPSGVSSRFITVHGEKLRSLLLFTPKVWPTRLHPSPASILTSCPNLRHLSLEKPLPRLHLYTKHPLRILSIPRPDMEFWRYLEPKLRFLPGLTVLRTRDVKWLRSGMNSRAREAGVQGEMREWKKRLRRYGIQLLDAEWSDIKE